MEITRSSFTISEIRDMWQRRELIVNKNYQRSSSVWPDSARTYFIDTILNRYIFPKVYFYQVFDKTRKKVIREIVDGQQRLTTILCFLNDDFPLTSRSVKYQGKRFSDLDEDLQQQFLTYSVEVDIIYSAEQSDLLAMFTRMNAYTAPLNPAEKRHAEFEGQFKWFIIGATGEIGPRLVNFNVLTSKQAIRMHDAEFLTELAIVLDLGIINKSDTSLTQIYRKYDKSFPCEEEFRGRIYEFMHLLEQEFAPLKNTFITKSYVCHSLFCALMQKKYGIPNGNEIGTQTDGVFFTNLQKTIDALNALAGAHELQDKSGPYGPYVEACLSTTHRIKQRKIRSTWLYNALI
ncbi:DUF262 domain-containing protein [Nitrosomonas sp.]|uniref:GmrSD restriction endonuclease domain-containing protein n=1 Tax=Nitrosomonas sp. TaxID=42353 RepID=UPI0026144E19|nr:DUF262 domain-containing protein [Nitrosomonas sp.]MCW5601371.1 DUF262 domain-containing protein [Nitrosomonas sp.]